MSQSNKKKETNGSITVFLSLVLFLILALLLTTIEGARVITAKTFAERSLNTAMDSVLAEFYAPLMEEYHILGLDTGYGTNTAQEEPIIERLRDYMSYTFLPNQRLSNPFVKDGIQLFDISTLELLIEERTNLMDYQGELFINEAVEYMKYEKVADVIELFLGKASMLESPEKVSVLYEEKLKVEDELVEIDKGILKLMKLLDGVKTSDSGLETDKNGALKVTDYFVKKICLGEVSKEQVGINNGSIFQALQTYYFNPFTDFKIIEDTFLRWEEIIKEEEVLREECSKVEDAIIAAEENIDSLYQRTESTTIIKQAIKEAKQHLSDLQDCRNVLQTKIADCVTQKDQCSTDIQEKKIEISTYLNKIMLNIIDSIPVIDQIIETSSKADSLISTYENNLYNGKNEIEEETFLGLEEELTKLKKYSAKGQVQGYDFAEMKRILETDLSVLTKVNNHLDVMVNQLSGTEFSGSKQSLQSAKEALNTYQISGLTIDYSSLVLSKKEDNNPLSMIKSLINDGVMGLVVDPNTISEAEIINDLLPSTIAAMAGEGKGGYDFDITSILSGAVIGESKTEMSDIFGNFTQTDQSTSLVGAGINAVSEHLLFQEYILEHFAEYQQKTSDTEVKKPSVLDYEQEYILIGKTKDYDNIASVISRIVFLRTVLNFVSILGDRTRCSEATIAATALVGFTGLPILVSITKALILIIWAFAEALVDTCALLQGKEIPFIKKKSDLILTYTDLFQLNRLYIEKKATAIKDGKDLLSFTYQDYMRIFLMLKKKEETAYRAMDLIQENLRIRYEDTFSLQNCIFGFKVSANFHIKSKFLQFEFLKKQFGYVDNGYNYKITREYSY